MLAPQLSHEQGVQSVQFTPDGRFILTASEDCTVHFWQADDLQPAPVNPVLRQSGRLVHACISPDGHQILMTGADGSARIWDLAGGAAKCSAVRGQLSLDGNRFLIVTTNGVQVCEAKSGQPIGPILAQKNPIEKALLGPEGHFLVIISGLGEPATSHLIEVRDVLTGRDLGPGLSFSNAPAGVDLDAQGRRMVAYGDHWVRSFDVVKGAALSPVLSHADAGGWSMLSHDGKKVVTVSGSELRVWDALNGRALFPHLTLPQPIRDAQFSPDDRYVAIGCADKQRTACYAQVFSSANGHACGPALNHAAGVLGVAFSPDGQRVITAGADMNAIIWDYVTGRQLTPPLKHQNQVCNATFSADGRWVVTACADGTARVWDAASGEPLTAPLRHTTALTRAGFIAGQDRVFTVDGQGGAQLWEVVLEMRPLEDLLSVERLLCVGSSAASSESLESLWQRLKARYPVDFTVSPEEIAAWHSLQAQQSELRDHWSAAVFHLERISALRPNDTSLAASLARARVHLDSAK
jgi:WD40 repeat protein